MKRTLFYFFVACILSSSAHADIIDNGSFFLDTETNYTWVDLSVFKGKSYDYVDSLLINDPTYTGFEIATRSILDELWSSTYTKSFNYLFDTMGGTLGSDGTQFIGGIFDNGLNNDRIDLAWTYNYRIQWIVESEIYENPDLFKNGGIEPFGVWVVKTSTSSENNAVSVVPEPTTMLLYGIGLLGLAAVGRRRN